MLCPPTNSTQGGTEKDNSPTQGGTEKDWGLKTEDWGLATRAREPGTGTDKRTDTNSTQGGTEKDWGLKSGDWRPGPGSLGQTN
jgi:hypothetical protein